MALESIMLLRAAIGIIGAGVSLTSSGNRGKFGEAIFSETFGGIIADWFRDAGKAGFEKLKSKLDPIDIQPGSLNHDLQRAARKAQLIATFFAAQSCLAKLEAEKSAQEKKKPLATLTKAITQRISQDNHTEDYLRNVIRYLNDEIKKNETAVYGDRLTIEEFSSVFDTYQVAVDSTKQAEIAKRLRNEFLYILEIHTKADSSFKFDHSGFEMLRQAVMNGWDEIPSEVQADGEFLTLQLSVANPAVSGKKYDWFKIVCLLFNEEYKSNQKILAASQKQLLLGISRKLDSFGTLNNQTVEVLTTGIAGIASQLTALQAGMDKANEGIDELKQGVSHIRQKLESQGSSANHLSDVPREIELNYLRWMQTTLEETCFYTRLRGGVERRREMPSIKSLFRHWRHDEDTPQVPREFEDAIPVMRELRRVILLGDPGGGKTTTLAKFAADLATEALQNEQAPIPLFVRLGGWVEEKQSLPDFIAEYLSSLVQEAEDDCDLSQHIGALLRQKRAALLLDGLNEFPPDQRSDKYDEVRKFIAEEARQNKELLAAVSCRELDYPEADLKFDRILITPLDPVRIRDFVTRYLGEQRGEELFWKLAGEKTREYHTHFIAEVGAQYEASFWCDEQLPAGVEWSKYELDHLWFEWLSVRAMPTSLMQLARNPYLLSMLTQVFEERGELPENRGDLFRQFVNRLMKRENISDEEQKNLLSGLTKVARIMQMRADDEGNATTILSLAETVSTLGERLLYLARSATLLTLSDPVRFTHQLLQEYFAALWLDTKFRTGKFPAASLWKPDRWWQRNNWEEVAVLLAGLYTTDCTPVVEWLADANPEVAAQCIKRSGAVLSEATKSATLERLRDKWLPRLKSDPQPQARAAIGRALGQLGLDNRHGVGVVNGLPDIEWIVIPAGKFKYGHEDEGNNPPKPLLLPEFSISRFPVTYAQFQAFLDAPDGYSNPRWFDGLAADEDHRRFAEQYFKFDNHPRDTVNWYQAMAFCRWLSVLLGGGDDLSRIDGWAVRLPTEFEWEKAARGPNGKIYPYGDKFDATKCNAGETGIGQTSAVGIFPEGKSDYGVEEMSGNIWEWCLSSYHKPQREARGESLIAANPRVLRGGSWGYDGRVCRSALRNLNVPDVRVSYFGFRLVISARTL